MEQSLLDKLATVSSSPGVYVMKDRDGRIIYVGKAKNLKKRLSAYFRPPERLDMKTGVLVRHIRDFDTLIAVSEHDALLLESNLIKRHRPRYNVILKDDKRYPCLRLNVAEPYPAIRVVRQTKRDGALYFGPYSDAGAMRQALKVLNKVFKLRKCRDSVFKTRTRPCLNHQIGGCLGPCCLEVPPETYRRVVDEVVMFLRGDTATLVARLREEMATAAQAEEYEKAAELRDRMFALERTAQRQTAVTTDFMDRDIVGLAREDQRVVVTVMTVRKGYLVGSRNFALNRVLAGDPEVMEAVLTQYYGEGAFVPPEILLPSAPEDPEGVAAWLGGLRAGTVRLLHPKRGEKARLLALAMSNAADDLKRRLAAPDHHEAVMNSLTSRLGMDRAPTRIECFDNSNLQGTDPVAAMVVCENGRFAKSEYRKYRVRTVQGPDDYATMAEILGRRYGKGDASRPFPDLLLVDGGKGQLNIALAVLRELGWEGAFTVAGIAKKDETAGETQDKIYLPGRANPVNWGRESDGLMFLQAIRDETHRFAITFHRSRRRKTALTSVLDDIPGVGPARKKALIAHFGGIRKVLAATAEELAAVPGIGPELASVIRIHLDGAAPPAGRNGNPPPPANAEPS